MTTMGLEWQIYWTLLQPLIHSLCYFSLFSVGMAIALGINRPRRRYFAPLFLLPAWKCLSTIGQIAWPAGFGQILGLSICMGTFHAISILYIEEINVQPRRYVKTMSGRLEPEYRFVDIWKTTFNLRLLGVRPKGVPEPPGGQIYAHPKYIAINNPFTWWRVMRLFALILINHYIVPRIFPGCFEPLAISDFSPIKHVYFRRLLFRDSYHSTDHVTLRETYMRLALTATTFFTPYLLLEASHIGLAILFIHVLRTDTRAEWPELFGNPLESYTLARFWSRFWHSAHLAAYTSWAGWFTDWLPWSCHDRPQLHLTLTSLIIFAITGLIHAVSSWETGDTCAYWTDVEFYLVTWTALLLERRWLTIWRAFKASRRRRSASELPATKRQISMWRIEDGVARMVGYMWWVLFHFWLGPKTYYPKVWCRLIEHAPPLLGSHAR